MFATHKQQTNLRQLPPTNEAHSNLLLLASCNFPMIEFICFIDQVYLTFYWKLVDDIDLIKTPILKCMLKWQMTTLWLLERYC